MKLLVIFASAALPSLAFAQVATPAPGPLPQLTPSITLTGPEADQLEAAFAKPSLMQIAPDGSMTPLFVVDGRSIHAMLQAKIAVARAEKAKADAEAKKAAETKSPEPAPVPSPAAK